jgi:hypothetical protein
MSRKSGNRFPEKDMRQQTNPENIAIQFNRDVLWALRRRFWTDTLGTSAENRMPVSLKLSPFIPQRLKQPAKRL